MVGLPRDYQLWRQMSKVRISWALSVFTRNEVASSDITILAVTPCLVVEFKSVTGRIFSPPSTSNKQKGVQVDS